MKILLTALLILIYTLPLCAEATELTQENIDGKLNAMFRDLVAKSREMEEIIYKGSDDPDNLVSEILEYIRTNNNSQPQTLSFEKKKLMYERFTQVKSLIKKTGIPKELPSCCQLYDTVSGMLQDIIELILVP